MRKTRQITLSQGEFARLFRPIFSPLVAAGIERGRLQYGDDQVWSVISSNGQTSIRNGVHFEDCLGYLFTENAWSVNASITVGPEHVLNPSWSLKAA